MPRRRRSTRLIASILATAVGYLVAMSSSPPASAAPSAAPQLVPEPVSMTVGTGDFTITRHTHIVAEPGSAARVVAEDLAAYLRPATGYPLPVASGPGRDRDIRLALGDAPGLTPSQAAEGYVLDAGPARCEPRGRHGTWPVQRHPDDPAAAAGADREPDDGPGPVDDSVGAHRGLPAVRLPRVHARHRPALPDARDGDAADRRGIGVQDQHPAPARQRRPGLPDRHRRLPEPHRHR